MVESVDLPVKGTHGVQTFGDLLEQFGHSDRQIMRIAANVPACWDQVVSPLPVTRVELVGKRYIRRCLPDTTDALKIQS
jgi:hypothetical protein